MILVDMNQISYSAINAYCYQTKSIILEENIIKHIVYNTLRSSIKKFKNGFGGNIVICFDNKTYWRKKVFSYYKSNRKFIRDKSTLDWDKIFSIMEKIKTELESFFPYIVLSIQDAEADDIIGVLAKLHSNYEKILIISADKDFIQCQRYKNIKQYDPKLGEYISYPNILLYLKEKIIHGDKGDGIPNILSNDDVFIIGKRQKSIFKEKLNVWLNQDIKDFCTEEMYKNYERNRLLIDFEYIPQYIIDDIIKQYNEYEIKGNKTKIFRYFFDNKMFNLLENIQDF